MDDIIERAKNLLAEADLFATIDYLNQQVDPVSATEAYRDLVKHCYYQNKNLPAVIALSHAGIQFATVKAAALFAEDRDLAQQLRAFARSMAYNLASYTWPGWDEPGIVVDDTAQAIGLQAARASVRLAHDLDKNPLAVSRAYWMLGVQQMAAGDLEAALGSLARASLYAEAAGEEADQLLAISFSALARWLQAPQEEVLRVALHATRGDLAQLEFGDFFVDQLDTAMRVFASDA